ncbi:transposase family protein [Rothia dentocariosa]
MTLLPTGITTLISSWTHTILSLIKATKDSDSPPPAKKPPGGKLTKTDKQLNRRINRHRVVIERVIAHVKCWRVLSAIFRRPMTSYRRVFSVVRAVFFWLRDNP